jgi:hypothetical protein
MLRIAHFTMPMIMKIENRNGEKARPSPRPSPSPIALVYFVIVVTLCALLHQNPEARAREPASAKPKSA